MPAILTSKPLSFFHPDPNQPRKSFAIEELRLLRDSLVKKQLVPVLAKPDGTLLDGERRWRAGLLDGKPAQLDVIITDEPVTDAQVKEIQLVTALHRADLTPYEQYLGCMDWLRLHPGAAARDLAATIDRDGSMLTVILSLANCIPAVQDAAAKGKLGPGTWYAISKAPQGEQDGLLAAKLAGASREQLDQRRKKAANSNGSAVRINRLKIPLGPNGLSVTIAGDNLSLDDAIEALQETLKFARKAQSEKLDGKTWVQVMQQKAKAGG